MPYTKNPNLPRLRAKAVNMVRNGKSIREVARTFGFNPSTIMRWTRKTVSSWYCDQIPTLSSRPNKHPQRINIEIIQRIVELRKQTGRCAEIIHKMLQEEGLNISQSSVKRILKRNGLVNSRNKYKRLHISPKRPLASKAGDLIEVDTIHLMTSPKQRIYVYTLIDVFSRFAFAKASEKINARISTVFLKEAQKNCAFSFNLVQSDNGPEFSQHFTERIKITHRHSRVRRPNDNAHLERFNRTIQQEFINKVPLDVKKINKLMPKYLKYYNEKRLHLGINLKTPYSLVKCCQAID